jgi:small subunit ribosomal protein S3
VTAGGGRRRAEQGEPGSAPTADAGDVTEAPDDAVDTETETTTTAPLPGATATGAPPDDLERLLAEEEEIERRTRNEHHETPHFRKDSD